MAYEIRIAPETFSPNVAIGVKAATEGVNPGVFISTYSTKDQAISNLKNLLLTYRGERPMQPLFGTRLRDALFEQNTDSIKDFITSEITQAVSFWLPYITINRLDVQTALFSNSMSNEHGISVSLFVSVNNQRAETPITFIITTNSIQAQ
jgi:phage baseplate assembly protein W